VVMMMMMTSDDGDDDDVANNNERKYLDNEGHVLTLFYVLEEEDQCL
jgi:hypothetical protein